MTEGRKKVLFLITKGTIGGAQRYVRDLATKLPQDRYNAVVAYGEGGALEKNLEAVGIRTIRIPLLSRDIHFLKEIRVFISILKLLKEEKPDILHLNSSKIGGLGALAGRVRNVPRIVFTAHGWASNEDRGFISRKVIKFFHWLTVILSHVTIAVSDKTRSDISYLPFVRNKIRVVYNGIEPAELEPKNTVRTLIAPQIHEGVWIGTISELHRNKGIDYALRAFAFLADMYQHIVFVVIGDGEERDSLERLAAELGIADKVHFLGSFPDAGKLVQVFDMFTLTSRTEALPYAALEAGRAGVAVVAARVGGLPEIIANKYNGLLVEPGNVEEIANALTLLIEHPDKRAEYGARLQKRISKKFSIENMVRETARVYEG